VKRSEATRRIEGLLGRVVSGEGRYLSRVREVSVFGSFARGALEVGDGRVRPDEGRGGAVVRDPDGGRLRPSRCAQARASREQRVLEIHFNELDELRKEGFEPQLLWRRGDSLEEGRARLATLAPDASAQRAARDTCIRFWLMSSS
jgi:hypothetical protein